MEIMNIVYDSVRAFDELSGTRCAGEVEGEKKIPRFGDVGIEI